MLKLLKKQLPDILSLDKKELFMFALKNPDKYTYLILKHQWISMEDKSKVEILTKYKKNKFSTMSDILVSNRKMSKPHLMIDFFLSSGFEFNKKDKMKLKANEWINYEKHLSGVSQKKSKFKILNIFASNISVVAIVELLNKDMVKVLGNYIDKLPSGLKQRVIKESDSAELLKIYEFDL